MAPAAHHRVIDAGGPIALDGDDDVQVLVARTVGELLVQHLGQRADLVAYLRRLLEGEVTVLKSVSSGAILCVLRERLVFVHEPRPLVVGLD